MSRWTIEKDGTGIEKSGTGIEKSGTGIEKSGTGIEKSGTGIEKSGTGIRRSALACSLAALVLAGSVHAGNVEPAGSLQLVVQNNKVAVSWIIGESVFSGISSLSGSYANLMLTEVALGSQFSGLDVTGNGTGTLVTGNGTGNSIKVTGNGTGSSIQVTGNGTGASVKVTGNGTGSSIRVTGNGTGSSVRVTGNGTGSSIRVTGNGTGADAITITLPNGTGMAMEVSVNCGFAQVTVSDFNSAPIVAFSNVPVIGGSGFCSGGFGGEFDRISDRNR